MTTPRKCTVCLNEQRETPNVGTERRTICAGGWPIYRTLCDEHAPAAISSDSAYTGDAS